jgi:hypothetical protein
MEMGYARNNVNETTGYPAIAKQSFTMPHNNKICPWHRAKHIGKEKFNEVLGELRH